MSTPEKTCVPPTTFKRNEHGLYTHIDYIFKENGKVDWRKMIPVEFIVPNTENTSETDITKLEDKDLLIKLGGFKYLAWLRGYRSIRHEIKTANELCVAVETTILWEGNYETLGDSKSFTALADATVTNTKGLASNFLSCIAENRGFVRAVRSFLEIPIVGNDEMKDASVIDTPSKQSNTESHGFLENTLKDNNIKFESFKNRMIKLKVEGADKWENVSSVPDSQVFEVIALVRNILEKKAADQKIKAEKEALDAKK